METLLGGWQQQSRWSLAINGFLFLNGIVFIALYYYYCGHGKNYVDIQLGGESISRISVLIKFLSKPMISLMLFLTGYRLIQVFYWKNRRYMFEDSVLLTGTSYVFAFAWLRLSADYYLIPAYTCWFCAIPGYFTSVHRLSPVATVEYGNWSTSAPSRAQHSQENSMQLGIFGMMIIACLGISKVIKGGEMVRDGRAQTHLADQTIRELVNSGYEIYVYLPSEISSRDLLVQSWRQLVINTFYNCSWDGSTKNESDHYPCRTLSLKELENHSAANKKSLIIYDSKYDYQSLNSTTGSTSDFCRVFEFPLLLGARTLAPQKCVAEIKSVLQKHRLRRY